MKLIERLDNLHSLAQELKNDTSAPRRDNAKKRKALQKELKECEDILSWFRKEMTKPGVQMSLDPYVTKGRIVIPLINLSGTEFENFSFECVALDYNGTVLEKAKASCRTWKKGDVKNFRISVPKESKSVTVLVDSIDYEGGETTAVPEKKPYVPTVDTVCPFCKKEIVAFSKFCHHCGRQLMTDEERSRKKEELLQYEIKQEKTRYLRVLDEAGEELGEEDLCAKIGRLRGISENIYTRIQERPDLMQQVNKFDNIYLPAIQNAVQTYVKVRDAGVDAESVEKSRADAEMAIDIGIHSSQKLLNSMYKGDQLDVEGDIEVLKQMFTETGPGSDAADGSDRADVADRAQE